MSYILFLSHHHLTILFIFLHLRFGSVFLNLVSTSLIQHPSPQAQISNNWIFAQNAVLYKQIYLIPLKIKKLFSYWSYLWGKST